MRTGKDYTDLRTAVWIRDRKMCVGCGLSLILAAMHLHHKFGRKFRDDIPRKCESRCVVCHDRKHRGALTMPCQVEDKAGHICGAKASDCCIVCLSTLCADPEHQLRCSKCNDPICPGCKEEHEAGCKG